MKRILKEYFSFSKKERNAAVVLVLLIALFLFFPYFYSPKTAPPKLDKELEAYLSDDSITITGNAHTSQLAFASKVSIPGHDSIHLFVFDPNTVSENSLKKLGLDDKVAHTIINYSTKGGKFRQAEDIRKIWGLRKEDADHLIPYIRINQANIAAYQPKPAGTGYTGNIQETKTLRLDINKATVDEWKKLRGIGDVLANRIIRFREKSGGFVSVEQVKKTYGINDSLFNAIKPFLFVVTGSNTKLDINKASARELVAQTGIPGAIASAIVIYRKQYGNYQSVAQLQKVILINDSLYQLIKPKVFVGGSD